jgi:TolA-binding protein
MSERTPVQSDKRRQLSERRIERMNQKRVATFAVVMIMGFSSLFAQTMPAVPSKPADGLRRGIELFAEARYAEALPLFDAILIDPAAGPLRADGAYWSAITLLAAGDPQAAEKAIETFLAAFPGHARTGELIYQKARAAYLQKDYDRAIKSFQAYTAAYPSGEMVSSAVFWTAESLYSLGRLTDAEKLYKTIGEKFQDSVKAEAAKYRLSLIQFKYREDELLTLLKWSHEESLRIIEEFQRREKAYEQALEVYQKRYGEAKRGVAQTQASLEDQVASLRLAMDDLAKRLQEKDARVSELEKLAASAASATKPEAAPPVAGDSASGDVTNELQLLAMKERALVLMQFYIERLSKDAGSRGRK